MPSKKNTAATEPSSVAAHMYRMITWVSSILIWHRSHHGFIIIPMRILINQRSLASSKWRVTRATSRAWTILSGSWHV